MPFILPCILRHLIDNSNRTRMIGVWQNGHSTSQNSKSANYGVRLTIAATATREHVIKPYDSTAQAIPFARLKM